MIEAAAVQKVLLSVAVKSLSGAFKLWKERAEKAEAAQFEALLQNNEASKALDAVIAQRLSVTLKTLSVSEEVLDALRRVDSDPVVQQEIASSIHSGQLHSARLAEILTSSADGFRADSVDVLLLCNIWCDAITFSIGQVPALAHALQLQSLQRTEAVLNRSELKLDSLTELVTAHAGQQTSELARLTAAVERLTRLPIALAEPASEKQPSLRSRFQKRFDALRDELIRGSIRKAEEGYSELIADLEAAGELSDTDLLFRSYLNHSSALIEEDRFAEASAQIANARALYPDDLRLKRHTVLLLARQGDFSEALRLTRELRVYEPSERKHILNEAGLLFALGRIYELSDFLENHPVDDSDYFCCVSEAALRQGDTAKARAAARKACDLDPENEQAWLSLAYALGFPVIQRRESLQPKAFWVDTAEVQELEEAIGAAERAIGILRRRDRLKVLTEVLVNQISFYAALGQDDDALTRGRQLWAKGERSETFVRNLFYLQMRNGFFDEALSTARALETFDAPEAEFRFAQALVAKGDYMAALEIWSRIEARAGAGGPADEWVELASGAWRAAQQRERALGVLEDALSRHPGNADLYLEKGQVLEELGRDAEAETALIKAEELAPSSIQVAVDYAGYLNRHQRWSDAVPRFERAGAASIVSPLLKRYLIALFNSGRIAPCVKLLAEAFARLTGFDETIYALRARCSMLAEDFTTARELLEELLRHGGEHNLEHRKMLGQVYIRLDEQERAYNLLAKVVAEQARDRKSACRERV